MGLTDIPVYIDNGTPNHSPHPVPEKPPVQALPEIVVNGQAIDKTELAQEIQHHPADSFAAALQSAAQALVIRRLLQEAAKDKLAAGIDEESAFAELMAENTVIEAADDTACYRLYQQNPTRFQAAPLMVVRHILFAADKADLDGRAQQRQTAERILADLQAADTDAALRIAFGKAVNMSRCPSKKDGGMLGELAIGQTVPEFERQVFALEKGLATQLIETRYGYHIVWVVEKAEGKLPPYETVKPRIAEYLNARSQRQAAADYLYRLAENAHIEGFQLSLQDENIIVGL